MIKMKTIAMYLPQFHRLPENDEWWGEGFTEWTAVQAAEKFFPGHNQRREPLNDNYYDLMKKETMEWQAKLAKEYGIGGFCFYHYYFKNGRKILEKPAENLLKWKDIDMPFCFCWANETWARTWSNINFSNAWSDKFEKEGTEESGILLEQSYGTLEDWKEHFDYLFPFFEDERYIRVNGKPIFLFYKTEDIPMLSEMIECWQGLMREMGHEGIYIIGVNSTNSIYGLDAVLYQGPAAYRMPHILGEKVQENWETGIRTYDNVAIWENAIRAKSNVDCKVYYGGFVDYDDTPRRGKLGVCTSNVSPKYFEDYLYKLAVKNMALDNELLFINAWNEWGEGNYLEPDKRNEYQFLEAVRRVMEKCNAECFDAISEWNVIAGKRQGAFADKEKQALLDEINKFRNMYEITERWLTLKQNGESLETYFVERNYHKVVIYGFAAMGRHLYEELKNTSVEVVCVMDRRQGLVYSGVEILSPDENIPECDVVVVTAISEYKQIAEQLKQRIDKPIICLRDAIES